MELKIVVEGENRFTISGQRKPQRNAQKSPYSNWKYESLDQCFSNVVWGSSLGIHILNENLRRFQCMLFEINWPMKMWKPLKAITFAM